MFPVNTDALDPGPFWSRAQRNVETLQWRHNGCDSVSNHQPHDCLLKRLFRRRSKKTSKPRVTGLCAGISPGTGGFPAQMASYAENVPFDDVIMETWRNKPSCCWGWGYQSGAKFIIEKEWVSELYCPITTLALKMLSPGTTRFSCHALSPGQWYWLCEINWSLCSIWTGFNNLRHLNVDKWWIMQIFHVS